MARLVRTNFKPLKNEHYNIHKPTSATFFSFTEDGQRYLQIDTYGTEGRMEPGKTSQCIQIDQEMAVELVSLLKQEFHIL